MTWLVPLSSYSGLIGCGEIAGYHLYYYSFKPATIPCHNDFNSLFISSLFHNVYFFNIIFVSNNMYPENPEATRVILGSMNMGFNIYPTRPQAVPCVPIPLGHSDGGTV